MKENRERLIVLAVLLAPFILTLIARQYGGTIFFLIFYTIVAVLIKTTPKESYLPQIIERKIERKKRYLQVSLNSDLETMQRIVMSLPETDRILVEVGSTLINKYGVLAVSRARIFASYLIADNKCADLAPREVEMMANAGADAITCLGVAPIETIDSFIEECQRFKIDSVIDMTNVENPLEVLKKLKRLPNSVVLNRGVNGQVPYYQIKQIKGSYNLSIAVAGSRTIKEVQSAIFNAADIVIVGEELYQEREVTDIFLKKIR